MSVALYASALEDQALATSPQESVGLNKFDLSQQYLGVASGGNGSSSYIAVERAMARKAIVDASYADVKYLRLAIAGFGPSIPGERSDLALWLTSPELYWAAMDEMMDDLSRHDIQVVATLMFNPLQFPSMTGDSLGDLLRNPHSRSWELLAKYVSEFVNRYRAKKVILLYEMTNELNVSADIDLVAYCYKKQNPLVCKVTSNFTSSELIAFTGRFYHLIKSLDPSAVISTGFSLPRASADHLRQHPAILGGKPDWTPDTTSQAFANWIAVNQYADVLSVHIYPGLKFGNLAAAIPDALVAALDEAAKRSGKPLFIGEFGDKDPRSPLGQSFIEGMLAAIKREHVLYSALWVWEFYQRRTYLTYDTPPTLYNLEPGYTDKIINDLQSTNAQLEGKSSAAAPASVPEVVITAPRSCQLVNLPFTADAVASAAGKAVSKVVFMWDRELLKTVLAPPYSAVVAAGGAMSGTHQLTAIAFAPSGQAAQYSVNVDLGHRSGEACAADSVPPD